MKRKRSALALALLLAFTTTACSSALDEYLPDSDEDYVVADNKTGWIDSDLRGAIKEDTEIRLQDDFAAATNKQWKLEIGDTFYDSLRDVESAVLEKMKKAATDESIQGTEAETLRKYYALSSDWDYRNTQGVEPLKSYIEDIESIGSVDELYTFFADLNRNPLALAPISISVLSSYHTNKYPDINLVAVEGPELSLTDSSGQKHYTDLNTSVGLEAYEQVQSKTLYMLQKMGYSEKEAEDKLEKCVIWEKKVFQASEDLTTASLEEYVVETDKILDYVGSFPLGEILKGWGFEDFKYMVMSPGYARKLKNLCGEGNLENVKDYMIVNYCLKCASFLDRETFDTCEELGKSRSGWGIDTGMSEEQNEENLQFKYYIGDTAIIGAMNKVYAENFFNDELTGELEDLTKEIIDELGNIFEGEEWLTDEGKKLCLEKLKNIKIHIAHQSFEVLDYSKTPFLSKEEGGSFLEAYLAMMRYEMYHKTLLSKLQFDRGYWDPLERDMATTVTNAFYNPATNGIYICAGICERSAYASDMSYEEKLAGLGTIVGHELTHGFDNNGSLYDKEGMREDWMSYDDQSTFNDKVDKVAAYYSDMTPFQGSGLYSGTNLTGEATADMGGIKAALGLASKVPDFDYDLFFRSYANLWRSNVPVEVEKMMFKGDPHPHAFYRINVGLQQFDEFYETYGITEDDSMYLAPEKRIKVW